MSEYLFDQHIQVDGETPNLFLESQKAILTEIPSIKLMAKHWGVNTRDERINSTVKIEFMTGGDHTGLSQALTEAAPTPDGETFDLVRFIAPGVIFKGLVYTVECSEDLGITFDIQVVKATNGEVVQELKGIKAHDDLFANGEMLAQPELVIGGEVFLLKVKFNKLPFKNDKGDGVWGDQCNNVPCLNIRVHALTEDTCHAPRIGMAGCCVSMPKGMCDE